MRLHENKPLFEDYVALVSQTENIDEAIVLKDYYVTLTLKTIYENYKTPIFIGGTALSKCFGLIDRFSEDIDMVAKEDSRKASQRKTSDIIETLKRTWTWKTEESNDIYQDFKELYLHYSSDYDTDLDQRVKLELITFMDPFPTTERTITPMIYEYLEEYERKTYDVHPIRVVTQEPYRTMIEKILLEKELYKEVKEGTASGETQSKRARDFYDIHKIWCFYGKRPPVDFKTLEKIVDSRVKSRKRRTAVPLSNLLDDSLQAMFDTRKIANQLETVDRMKLSIRDLDCDAIRQSLDEIDAMLTTLIRSHK